MTDIAALFDDALFPLELTHRVTKEPLGVKFYLAPHVADPSVDRWETTAIQMSLIRNDTKSISDIPVDEVVDLQETANIRRCAASIRRWEWNGKSFGALGADPECTMENKIAVLSDPGASWIVDQVFTGGATIANFTRKPDAT